MRAIHLNEFGLEKLSLIDAPQPAPSEYEVLVKLEAASLNPRDAQIIAGNFTPDVAFPLVPLSDGAGTVVEVGAGVTRFKQGDRCSSVTLWEETAPVKLPTTHCSRPG